MKRKTQSGFTLSELLAAIATSSVVILAFGSALMFTRNEFSAASDRVGLAQDAVIVDRYVRNKLTIGLSDSLSIYADASAEQAGLTSETGTILRLVLPDTTVHHISLNNHRLVWIVDDSITHYPVDADVQNLVFRERDGNMGKLLDVSMEVCSPTDTLEYAWDITLRN